MANRQEVMDLIKMVIESYERMLQKIVIEKDKEFNSVPYERSLSALNQILAEGEKEEDE